MKPRPRVQVTVCVALGCALAAWLGWCAVRLGEAARDAYACKACVETGGTWSHGGCEVPAVNIQIVPRGSAEKPDPLTGPGGA